MPIPRWKRSELDALIEGAGRTGDLQLMDQATSERELYDGSPYLNYRVVKAVAGEVYYFHCPLCARTTPVFHESLLRIMEAREYCSACWTSGFEVAKGRLKYFEAGLFHADGTKGGRIADVARSFPADDPRRAKFKDYYRNAERAYHALQRRLERIRQETNDNG